MAPRRVTVGLSDGVNYIVKGGIAEGDTVITNASVGAKGKTRNANNPFMPKGPNRGRKNSSRGAGPNGPGK